MGPRNLVLARGQDQINPIAAVRGYKLAFCQITLDACLSHYVIIMHLVLFS